MSEKKAKPKSKDVLEAWAKSADDTAKHFGVNSKVGLSEEQVTKLREEFGFNELPAEERMPITASQHVR